MHVRGVILGLVLAPATVLSIATIGASPAQAKPSFSAAIQWDAKGFSPGQYPFNAGLPSGLTLSCYGTATGGGWGCADTVRYSKIVTRSGGYGTSDTSGVSITNVSNIPITDAISYFVDVGNISDGGIEAVVDDLATESVSFSASVDSPGIPKGNFPLCHSSSTYGGCMLTRLPGGGGALTISSFDDSTFTVIDYPVDLEPGDSIQIPFITTVGATFILPKAVPEPSSIALLAFGLLFLGMISGVARRRARGAVEG